MADDTAIHGEIERLVAEEHELWNREAGGHAGDDERRRLHEVEVALDRCWDVLRQRRALRDVGADPDGAALRSERVVEGYEQ